MSITTKKGDGGITSLWSGEKVWKSDARVEAYGTLDELDAHIGDARHYIQLEEIKSILVQIQGDLYHIMGELASTDISYPVPIRMEEVNRLTDIVHRYEDHLQLQGFVIPGNTISSAKLDICRTITRRAERRIVALKQNTQLPDEILLYVNRLSDVFFILARAEEKHLGKLEYIKKG
ncbi:MAG TPA: cob(I)yrinic acid a,c-diamide adenosyltransferase [Candidatus Cloacimonadota bacterium]|nr:cob(I)yrinic acid a,c-diamide adenosyltransferase [Candidatus Cloacimonadota bacterium]